MLLLLHGALADHSQFDTLVAQLETPTTRFDFAGHGRAPLSSPLRMQNLVDATAGYLDEQRIERTAIFGYSMGGYVALLLAARMPERVSRVVTLATKFDWNAESVARETSQLDADVIAAKVPRFAAHLESRHTAIGWKRLLSETADMMTALGTSPLLDAEQRERITCPVRLCVGDRDNTASVEETRAMQRMIKGAELEVFPGTPHPFERVSTARLAYSLREFIDR
jgi:pimeloyl-ACP methyl ester carboxylesterase